MEEKNKFFRVARGVGAALDLFFSPLAQHCKVMNWRVAGSGAYSTFDGV